MAKVTMPDPAVATAGPGSTLDGNHAHVTSPAGAADLAAWLMSPYRCTPVIVVTTGKTGQAPRIDVPALAKALANTIEVYLIDDLRLVNELKGHLPEDRAVFGDAARLFAPDLTRDCPLETFSATRRGDRATQDLIERGRALISRPRGRPGPAVHQRPGSAASPATRRHANLQPTGELIIVETREAAAALARHLLDPGRRWPVVAVSVHPTAGGPYIDAENLALELRGVAPVVLVSADATYGITETLGDRTLSVFYGAGRVYPTGTAWVSDMYKAPLHMCSATSQSRRVSAALITEALSAAHAAGMLAAPPRQQGDRVAAVRVEGPAGSLHALVRAESGQQAVMLAARITPGVRVDRLVQPGQHLSGRLRAAGLLPEFIPDDIEDDPSARVRAAYPDGSVALARVAGVAPEAANVQLHPGVAVELAADRRTPDLTRLLAVGDVVAVAVAWVDDQCLVELADDADAGSAVPVVPGGPPWLVPEDAVAAEEEPEAAGEQVAPVEEPARPQASSADDALRQLAQANDAVAQFAGEVARLQRMVERQESDIGRLRKDLRRAQRSNPGAADGQAPVYADPEQQLRHEIALAYLHRVPEPDRTAYPLPERYTVGSRFLQTLQDLHGISREKVIDVAGEVLCGLARELPSRQLHPWRSSDSGPQEVRSDGAAAWRVSLQVNTPGARRLRYWKLRDGTIELDSVGVHDQGIA